MLLYPGWGGPVQDTLRDNFFGYPTSTPAEAETTWSGAGAALYALYTVGLVVEGNTFTGAWEAEPVSPVGIRLDYCKDVTVRRNRIYNLRSLSPDGYGAIGIHLVRETRYGASPHLIENNYIADLVGGADESLPGSSAYAVAGILLESLFPDTAATFTLRHNTIRLGGSAHTDAPWAKDGFSAALILGRNVRGGVEAKGNLFQNTLHLTSQALPDAKETCALLFWEPADSLRWSTLSWDGNFYYIEGADPSRTYLARIGAGAPKQTVGTLAEWRALYGLDATARWGIQGAVPFLSPDSPHIDPALPWEGINAAPVPPLVSTDFDGEPRPQGGPDDPGTAPDIGADELAGKAFPCPTPTAQTLVVSPASGLVGEPITFTVANPSALAGELALLYSTDGGASWHTMPLIAAQLPLTLPLPAPTLLPGAVLYRLAAYAPAGCPPAADTSATVSVSVSDRPGNRPATAIPISFVSIAPGVWEATLSDSLLGYGLSDELSSRLGHPMANLSPDLFYTLTLPDCMDSLVLDLCGTETDFDTRLHILMMGDTVTDRDQGLRADCTPSGVPAAYTSRIRVQASPLPQPAPPEDFAVPTYAQAPLPPGSTLLAAVEGESPLEVGHFRLTVRGYKLPLLKPDLGPDRAECVSASGIRISAQAPGATSYAWWVDGLPFAGVDSFIQPVLSLGSHTIVVEATKEALQPCATPQSLRDTLVLTVLPGIDAQIQVGNQSYDNGDTLSLSFGEVTFTAQAAAANPSFLWQVLNAQGIPIYQATGPTLTYEFGVRGWYGVVLESQSALCHESDTLRIEVQPTPSSLLRASEKLPYLWQEPGTFTLWLWVPPEVEQVEVWNALGQLLYKCSVSGEAAYAFPLPSGGIYNFRLLGRKGTYYLKGAIAP
uniref:Right handed beta helix domain-containing protein n=1 Tax=uncultured Bacteroidota bacterium TaxID=152509 RepID=H5SIE4_9BACT|nr:hypothetical protein HGMM_F32H02C03 [uncultured Bacteroidetes bacterium]